MAAQAPYQGRTDADGQGIDVDVDWSAVLKHSRPSDSPAVQQHSMPGSPFLSTSYSQPIHSAAVFPASHLSVAGSPFENQFAFGTALSAGQYDTSFDDQLSRPYTPSYAASAHSFDDAASFADSFHDGAGSAIFQGPDDDWDGQAALYDPRTSDQYSLLTSPPDNTEAGQAMEQGQTLFIDQYDAMRARSPAAFPSPTPSPFLGHTRAPSFGSESGMSSLGDGGGEAHQTPSGGYASLDLSAIDLDNHGQHLPPAFESSPPSQVSFQNTTSFTIEHHPPSAPATFTSFSQHSPPALSVAAPSPPQHQQQQQQQPSLSLGIPATPGSTLQASTPQPTLQIPSGPDINIVPCTPSTPTQASTTGKGFDGVLQSLVQHSNPSNSAPEAAPSMNAPSGPSQQRSPIQNTSRAASVGPSVNGGGQSRGHLSSFSGHSSSSSSNSGAVTFAPLNTKDMDAALLRKYLSLDVEMPSIPTPDRKNSGDSPITPGGTRKRANSDIGPRSPVDFGALFFGEPGRTGSDGRWEKWLKAGTELGMEGSAINAPSTVAGAAAAGLESTLGMGAGMAIGMGAGMAMAMGMNIGLTQAGVAFQTGAYTLAATGAAAGPSTMSLDPALLDGSRPSSSSGLIPDHRPSSSGELVDSSTGPDRRRTFGQGSLSPRMTGAGSPGYGMGMFRGLDALPPPVVPSNLADPPLTFGALRRAASTGHRRAARSEDLSAAARRAAAAGAAGSEGSFDFLAQIKAADGSLAPPNTAPLYRGEGRGRGGASSAVGQAPSTPGGGPVYSSAAAQAAAISYHARNASTSSSIGSSSRSPSIHSSSAQLSPGLSPSLSPNQSPSMSPLPATPGLPHAGHVLEQARTPSASSGGRTMEAGMSSIPGIPASHIVSPNPTTPATQLASSARRKTEPTHVCPVEGCGSTFTRLYNLKGHLRSHLDERPFKCDWPGCGKSFARAHDAKRHQNLHLNIKPHQCDTCKKTFARLDALNRHLKSAEGQGCTAGARSGSNSRERSNIDLVAGAGDDAADDDVANGGPGVKREDTVGSVVKQEMGFAFQAEGPMGPARFGGFVM